MDNGLTQAQASEALTHLAFYAGWPCILSDLAPPGAEDASAANAQLLALLDSAQAGERIELRAYPTTKTNAELFWSVNEAS